jgi:hypothetical protein
LWYWFVEVPVLTPEPPLGVVLVFAAVVDVAEGEGATG